MSKYTDLIYSESNNDYTEQLCDYIVKEYFNKYCSKLLDVGCSKGTHLKNFGKYHNVFGVDLRKDIPENSPYFNTVFECNIEKDNFPFEDNTFDYVWSKSVIEHISNPENMIKESYRVLKKNGIIIIMCPAWPYQWKVYFDDWTHYHPYSQKSLRDMLLMFGFKDVQCELFYQLPFLWNKPYLKWLPKIIDKITLEEWKWKTFEHRNGKDNKLIRFSKEPMLLACAKV